MPGEQAGDGVDGGARGLLSHATQRRLLLDGAAVDAARLVDLMSTNLGHSTAMQVRGSSVQGLDLHLARLVSGSRRILSHELDPALVLRRVVEALADTEDATVKVYVMASPEPLEPALLVVVEPPAPAGDVPRRLRTVRYQRPFADLKHTGTFVKRWHERQARQAGYDTALLVSPAGDVLETATANVALVRDDALVWPAGELLEGVTMQLLERRLAAVGLGSLRERLPLASIDGASSVVVVNSRGVAPVGQVDDTAIAVDLALLARVREALAHEPWQPLHVGVHHPTEPEGAR